MNKIKLAFLYNVRHAAPDPDDPASQLEIDFDDPEIVENMVAHFESCGFDVLPIEADENAYHKLHSNKDNIDIVFNYSEGIHGRDREAQLPAMLEMLKLPYTGASPFTQSVVLHKARTKAILAAKGVSTLPYQVFKKSSEKLNSEIKFPVIVKPVAHGSSGGITNASVVNNEKDLRERVEFILKEFSQDALVEPFLKGREFSVAMLGNPPQILGIVELNHHQLPDNYLPLASLDVKFFLADEKQQNYLTCPAEINDELKRKIENIAYGTWEALEFVDWCRMDIRCDENENPYLLEVNSPASLDPPDHKGFLGYCSYTLAAKHAGLGYQELLKKIVDTTLQRYERERK